MSARRLAYATDLTNEEWQILQCSKKIMPGLQTLLR
jgi:hypothetical protein